MGKLTRILLIDDDETTNFLNLVLINNLQLAHHVEALTDAEKALKLVEQQCPRQQCPDLILLDLKMPIFDGFDFLMGYQALPTAKVKKTKVVVLTTSSSPKDIKRLHDLGINQLVNKPLTKEKILELVA